MELSQKDIDKFWNKVDIKGEDECWEWLGNLDMGGYGKFYIIGPNNTALMAHRVSYFLNFGEIPDGMIIMHFICDNPKCVNPKHLKLGTQRENVEDCVNKGRRSPQDKDNNNRAILSEKKVIEIKRLFETGQYSLSQLSKIFGVAHTTISYLLKGKSWKGVGGEVSIPINRLPNHTLIEEEVVEIKKLLQEGILSGKEISELFNTTETNISCIKRGVSWKNIGELNIILTPKNKLKKEDIPIIKDMYTNGRKQSEIAMIYGVKSNTISEVITGTHWKNA